MSNLKDHFDWFSDRLTVDKLLRVIIKLQLVDKQKMNDDQSRLNWVPLMGG